MWYQGRIYVPGDTLHNESKLFFSGVIPDITPLVLLCIHIANYFFLSHDYAKKNVNEFAYLFYYLWAYFVWSFSALSFCTDFAFVLKLPRSSDAHAWDHKLNKSFVKYFDQILIHKQNWIIKRFYYLLTLAHILWHHKTKIYTLKLLTIIPFITINKSFK